MLQHKINYHSVAGSVLERELKNGALLQIHSGAVGQLSRCDRQNLPVESHTPMRLPNSVRPHRHISKECAEKPAPKLVSQSR